MKFKKDKPVFYVYRWTHVDSGKCYIGKGCGARALDHVRSPRHGSLLLRRAMARHGVEAFRLDYIGRNLDEESAFQLERETIAALGSRAPGGYNLTDGGEGPSGLSPGPETRAKLSEATKAAMAASPEWREKLRAAQKALWRDPSMRKRCLPPPGKGHPQTDAARRKISEARKGKAKSQETRARMASSWTPERRAKLAERNRAQAS